MIWIVVFKTIWIKFWFEYYQKYSNWNILFRILSKLFESKYFEYRKIANCICLVVPLIPGGRYEKHQNPWYLYRPFLKATKILAGIKYDSYTGCLSHRPNGRPVWEVQLYLNHCSLKRALSTSQLGKSYSKSRKKYHKQISLRIVWFYSFTAAVKLVVPILWNYFWRNVRNNLK